MKLFYSRWMRELDSETINKIGIPSIVLMENASRGAAKFFSSEYPVQKYPNVIVLVGKGNNGGDGLACGRILAQQGYQVEFILLSDPGKFTSDPAINYQIVKKLNLSTTYLDKLPGLKKILARYQQENTFIIDAVFGTGITKPVQDNYYSNIFNQLNISGFKLAAIDIPSGLSDSFLPEDGSHVAADITATFQHLKLAHIYPDGNRYCGKIKIIDIGIPWFLSDSEKYYIDFIRPSIFKHMFESRGKDSHKGDFGHCLNIAGSIEKPGAGVLCSYACLKSGAGLSTIAVKPENRGIPVAAHPELMTLIYQRGEEILSRLPEFDVILFGPGMGTTSETTEILASLLERSKNPLIIDADGLNVLSHNLELLQKKRNFPVVITPHPGEFSRLTGLSALEISRDRIHVAREFAQKYNLYIVLKGHHSLVISPEGKVLVNQTGNPGMATAGSGDVLGGLISGFISQFYNTCDLEIILAAAVFLHGFSGDLAQTEIGELALTASDLLEYFPRAILEFNEFRSNFTFAC